MNYVINNEYFGVITSILLAIIALICGFYCIILDYFQRFLFFLFGIFITFLYFCRRKTSSKNEYGRIASEGGDDTGVHRRG